jgi:O-antigen ligase
MEKVLLVIYLACLSFTSAFAITSTVTIPVLISLICVGMFFLGGIWDVKRSLTLEVDDLVILLFLLSVYLGFFINHSRFSSNKPINHLIAYSYVILVNYYLVKNIYYSLTKKFGRGFADTTYGAIYLGIFITCTFGILEFWLKNIVGIDVDSYIPRPAVTQYEPLALTDFIRLRSFVEESGHLAYFIEVFAPISLYFSRTRRYLFYPLLAVITICFILTFSTAGWLIVAITYLFLRIWDMDFSRFDQRFRFSYRPILKYSALMVVIALTLSINYNIIEFITSAFNEIIVYKVNRSASAEDRTARFVEGMNAFTQSDLLRQFFGNGPAVYDTLHFSRGGTILLYLTIILESGLAGLLFFLIFCGLLLFKAIKLQNRPLRFALMFALICSFLHFVLISNYWYPWFWVLAIFIQSSYRMEFMEKRKKEYILQNP